MPIAKIQLQDGRIARFEVPDGTTEDQVMSYVSSNPDQFAPKDQSKLDQQTPPKEQPARNESFQEANRRRFGELSQGVAQGLGNALIGGVQAATDLGEGAARGIEKMVYGNTMNQQTFGNRLADRVKALKEEQSKLPTSQRVGISLGETAPYLAVGNKLGLVKGGALAGGVSSFLSPQEETGLGNRLVESAKGSAAGAIASKAVGTALDLAPAATSAISTLTKKGVQKAFGVKPEAVQAFKDLGIDPTLADVTNAAGFQNFVKDFPGGGKPLTQALQKQINNISEQIQNVSKSQGGTYSEAGQQLKFGAENIKDKFSKTSEKLYNKVSELVPPETPVSINNTLNAIKTRKVQIRKEVADEDTAGYVKYIEKIEKDLAGPLKEGELNRAISYDALSALRSEIGLSLSGNLKPVEKRALGEIYAGLSKDIENTLKKADLEKVGDRSALKEWQKANRYYRVNSRFIDKNIQPLLDKGTYEEVYKYATSQARFGGTRIGQILKFLNNDQKEFVRGTLIRDLGLAQKGAQSAEANVFSPQKFMAEYSVLKKNGADKAIFTPEQRVSFDKLNKVIELTKNTEQAGKVNKGLQLIGLGTLGAGAAFAGGAVPGITSLAGAVGGARLTSNLMANPSVVNWLTKAAKSTPKELPKQLNQLSRIAAANPDIREDILQFLSGFIPQNANAEEISNQEDLRKQLEDRKIKEPVLMQGINPNQEAAKIKNRYYK